MSASVSLDSSEGAVLAGERAGDGLLGGEGLDGAEGRPFGAGAEVLSASLINLVAACSEISMPHTTSQNSLKLTCPSPFLSAFLMNSFVSVFMSADPSYVEEM